MVVQYVLRAVLFEIIDLESIRWSPVVNLRSKVCYYTFK